MESFIDEALKYIERRLYAKRAAPAQQQDGKTKKA